MRSVTAISFISACLISNSFAQLEEIERLEEIQQELDQTLESLHELETESGRLDRQLLEPLDQYSLALIENERYAEAHDILDQAIQIVRISEGLYSQTQFPLLVRHIENYIYRGDWTTAREEMQHLNWLINRRDNPINEELINTLVDLVDLHLWGVADDNSSFQSFHFRQAERLSNFVNRVARFSYGEDDARVPAIMYKKVVQIYLQAVAVEVGGPTGISLRSFSNTGFAISRSEARMSLYFSGMRSLNSMLNYFSDSEEPNYEGAGLVHMYKGDWEVLFGNSDAARGAYERANELLLAAGLPQETINTYSSQPLMLPLIDFHASLDDAIVATSQNSDGEGSGTNFTFTQWSAQFPRTKAPVNYGANEVDMEDGEYAMFSFNLLGLDRVDRWYRGRHKRNISSPQDLELVNRQISSRVDWFELTESIKDFHYRPKMVGGEPQSVSATLYFQLAD